MLEEAHWAAADLLGCDDQATTIFGANMTTLTLACRTIGRTWGRGDRVIVTQLDHDANVLPWVLAARDAGATVEHVRVRPERLHARFGSFAQVAFAAGPAGGRGGRLQCRGHHQSRCGKLPNGRMRPGPNCLSTQCITRRTG